MYIWQIESPPSSLILHPLHPCNLLHAKTRRRLLNNDIPDSYLSHFAMAHPPIVLNSRRTTCIVSGYHIWALLRLKQIDDPVKCNLYDQLTDDAIKSMGLADLLYPAIGSRNDEISRRLLAALVCHFDIQKPIPRRKLLDIKSTFRLPTRKRKTLDTLIANEDAVIRSMIKEAPSPIGDSKQIQTDIPLNTIDNSTDS